MKKRSKKLDATARPLRWGMLEVRRDQELRLTHDLNIEFQAGAHVVVKVDRGNTVIIARGDKSMEVGRATLGFRCEEVKP